MMSVAVTYSSNGFAEACDYCKVKDDQPTFEFYQSSREGKSVIWIHERCLQKRMDAAKKRAAKTAVSA